MKFAEKRTKNSEHIFTEPTQGYKRDDIMTMVKTLLKLVRAYNEDENTYDLSGSETVKRLFSAKKIKTYREDELWDFLIKERCKIEGGDNYLSESSSSSSSDHDEEEDGTD